MRLMVIAAIFVTTVAAGCQKSSDLLRPTPTASPESLVVQGTVRTPEGIAVVGATLRLTVIETDRSGSTAVGGCSGLQLGQSFTASSAEYGVYIIRFIESNVRPPICLGLEVSPPAGSSLKDTVLAQPNAFRYDRLADTLAMIVTLPR